MHLKKVTLNNFRCFENLELELHPRLTVLVAENGGGKTSILDGIALGLSPILEHLSSAKQRLSALKFQDTDFRLGGIPSEYAQVQIETTSGLEWNIASSFKDKQASSKQRQDQLSVYLDKVLDAATTDHPEPMPVFAYYGTGRGDFCSPTYLSESTVNYNFPTSALLGALDSRTDFEEMFKWFEMEDASELRGRQEQPEGFQEVYTLGYIRSAIRTILGEEKYQNPRINPRRRFVIDSVQPYHTFEIAQLSQGYKSMLALAMDYSRRLKLGNPIPVHFLKGDQLWVKTMHEYMEAWSPREVYMERNDGTCYPAIMLIDEIDLHLHPSWQQRVLGDLMRTFPGTQFIVTTHSPQVLSTVKSESIRILQSVDGRIVVKTPEYQTRGVESADVLAEIMGVDPIPQVEEAKWLQDYRALIEEGLQENEEGLFLRAKLIAHFGESHPLMEDCQRLIRFQAFKAKRKTSE